MIIKTEEFNTQFIKDIKLITINNKRPLQIKGSYKIKNVGSYISDIDLQAYVRFNPQLLNIIHNIIVKNNYHQKFIFIQLVCGIYNEFELPWKIDDIGGCIYDHDKTLEWFEQFKTKNLVPPNIIKTITDKLKIDSLTIKNLIDIEFLLKPYSQIVWKTTDIKNGIITKRNITYYLIHEIKKKTPVLEFLYKFKNNFISVDLALVDHNYKIVPQKQIYKFYTNDWYKILKTYRWKLENEDKIHYNAIMKEVEFLIAVQYQIYLLNRIKKHQLLDRYIQKIEQNINTELSKINASFSYTNNKLTSLINDKLEYYVIFFQDKLPQYFKEDIYIKLQRGIDSQNVIYKKEKKCPFFDIDIYDYKQIYKISKNIIIDHKKLLECIRYLQNKYKINIENIFKYDTTNTYFKIIDNEIQVYTNNIYTHTYPLKTLKKLQAKYILSLFISGH